MSTLNTADVARVGRAGLACLAGFGLLIGSASLADADYGPRVTDGNNYQQTSSTRSFDGINEGGCNGVASCYVLFQLAPQQKRLIIQHVSCLISVTAGEVRYGFLHTRKGQTVPLKRTYITPVPTATTFWVVNSPAMHVVKSNERPRILFANSATAFWVVDCNISGQLKQP